MIRLIDDEAASNDAWVHAVDIGHDFVTYWTKSRRNNVDKEFPHHDRERFHNGQQPQGWVEARWPGRRWAAHYHVDIGRPPVFGDIDMLNVSRALGQKILNHFNR